MSKDSEWIDREVQMWADDIAEAIKNGDVERDQPHDAIFEAVDSGWGNLGFPVCRIDEWPTNPGAEVLLLLGQVLEYCEEQGCVEEGDSGLWAGLHGAAVLGSQTFFSLECVLWKKLREMGVVD